MMSQSPAAELFVTRYGPGPGVLAKVEVPHRLQIGTRRFNRRMGDGNGQRTCRAPDDGVGPSAQADGNVRQLGWGVDSSTVTETSTK